VESSCEGLSLTPLAKKRISYGSFNLDFLVGSIIKADTKSVDHALPNSYQINKSIGKGATSFTFSAIQSSTYKERALKIFYPDIFTYEQIDNALLKRNIIRSASIPEIIEAGQILIRFPGNNNRTRLYILRTLFEYSASKFV
jgi:hypothetical protein